jgi:hypothetical protein
MWFFLGKLISLLQQKLTDNIQLNENRNRRVLRHLQKSETNSILENFTWSKIQSHLQRTRRVLHPSTVRTLFLVASPIIEFE